MLHPNERIFLPVDVDSLLVSYLKTHLGAYTQHNFSVSTKLPKNRVQDTYYVWLHSAGGSNLDRFSMSSSVLVNILGDDEDVVFNIATLIQGILHVAPLYLADIANVEPASTILPASEEDETPRFFQNFTVISRNKSIERT